MIKVGFIINFEKNHWIGGYNHFVNLFNFIDTYSKNEIQPIIITDNLSRLRKENNFKKFKSISTKLVSNSNKFLRIINKMLIILFGKNFLLERFLKKNDISILSHSGFTGKNSEIKSFPWFPDFQEIYFPENFTYKDRFFRKLNVILASKHSTKIIVSSKSVQKDLKKINLKSYKKSIVLKHTNYVDSFTKLKSIKFLKKKYKINKKFFLLPNHYWVHKNHIVALKALKHGKNSNFQIVSTGMCFDYRNIHHFSNLKKYIVDNKLQKRFKILGIVPFIDLCSLMHHSLAVINPSKSEGWGNSADQASLLGKEVILSNIPVHKEQNRKNFHFFNFNDYKKLSHLLKYYAKKKNKRIDLKKIEKNQSSLRKEYIKNFKSILIDY